MSRWNTYSCTCHISFFFQCQCQQPNAYTYTYVITKMYNALNTCQFSVVATFTYVLGKYHFTFPYLLSLVPSSPKWATKSCNSDESSSSSSTSLFPFSSGYHQSITINHATLPPLLLPLHVSTDNTHNRKTQMNINNAKLPHNRKHKWT